MDKKNYKKRNIILLLGMILAVLSVFVFLVVIKEKKSQTIPLTAHSVNEIKLNEGSDQEFVVPKDAVNLLEPDLQNQSAFDNYVQSGKEKEYISEINLASWREGFSDNNVKAVRELPNGEYLLAIEYYWAAPYRVNGIKILQVTSDGQIKFESKKDLYWHSTAANPEFLLASDSFIKVDDNRYAIAYSIIKGAPGWPASILGAQMLIIENTENGSSDFTSITREKIGDYGSSYLYSTQISEIGEDSSLLSGQIAWSNGKLLANGGGDGTSIPVKHYQPSTGVLSEGTPSRINYLPWEKGIGVPDNQWKYVKPLTLIKLADGNLLTRLVYQSSTGGGGSSIFRETMQVFDKAGNLINSFSGKLNRKISVQEAINNDDRIFFTSESDSDSSLHLMYYHVKQNKFVDVKQYQNGTELKVFPLGGSGIADGYRYFGYSPDLTKDPEFSKFAENKSSNMLMGTMSAGFDVDSLQFAKANGEVKFEKIIANDGSYFAVGKTKATDFSTPPVSPSSATGFDKVNGTPFFGELSTAPDFSPVIKKSEPIILNINDQDLSQTTLNSYGWSVLDNWLITGSKNGKFVDNQSIDVYDTYDVKVLSTDNGLDLLRKRINRNPLLSGNSSIEWQALGYKENKVGPFDVTYFVSDSQLQTSSTSRIVNNITDQTITKDKALLDAHNFHISLADVEAGSLAEDQSIRKLAKVAAWEKDSLSMDENAIADIFDDTKLSFPDVNQVNAIRKATAARPYPLDIEYKGSSTVVNRIWVFVIKTNTTVKNDVAMYADDYELQLFDAQQTTADKQLKADWSPLRGTSPGVIVYDYKSQPQTVDVLTPITIGENDGDSKGLGMTEGSLSAIRSAKEPIVLPNTTFTYKDSKGKTTTVIVQATLVGVPSLTVHLQQVIVSPNKALVVPEEGSIVASNVNGTTESTITATASQINLVSPSQALDFSTYQSAKLAMAYGFWAFKLTPMVPEYYQYEGYVVTEKDVPHQASGKQSGYPVLEGINHREYWVTLYLSPSLSKSESPQFYGWSYGNDKDYQVSP